MREPQTAAEWQEAADGAQGALALDSARKYGFLTGGPIVNVERCSSILIRAHELGIEPAADSIERFAREVAAA